MMRFGGRHLSMMIATFIVGIMPFVQHLELHAFGRTSEIPADYLPNYHIKEQRDQMLTMFIQIQATRNTGLELDKQFFADLYQLFQKVFPSLPQENSFKITYEQCRILTKSLADSYSFNKFGLFLDGCFSPLDKAINEMNSKYSIKADVKASPKSGSAPLSVTLDARGSTDPSNDTIPSSNYYWYYKNALGVDTPIGQGSVVNHSFDVEGNYVVHLTVRSVNQLSKGILDGSSSTSVNVSPESATLIIYANGQQLNEDSLVKMGSLEAKAGVLIDGSASFPKGGRVIQSHMWNIEGNGRSIYKKTNSGAPGSLIVPFTQEGQFTISLDVTDNENNVMKKKYSLVVADPLAIIRQNPLQGSTSTIFGFDASSSYSLVSNIKLYTWEIFDSSSQKIDTIQGKSIKKQFPLPGAYAVKLSVEDDQGRKNTETAPLFVESSDPTAQFSLKTIESREFPSQYLLDGSLSSDIDVITAGDVLSYQRQFSPQEHVTINESQENGKRVVVSFEQAGTYLIKLTVTDKFGKIGTLEKSLKIDSSLRPHIFLSPVAGPRGSQVKFLAKANKKVISFDWNLGDGTTRSTLDGKLVHSYEKVGVYPVKLTVYSEDGERNSIVRNVFVGEAGSPVLAYRILQKNNSILNQEDQCEVKGDNYAAYRMVRGQDFSIDTSDSVNSKGEKRDILFYFKPQDDNTYTQARFVYKFLELGCQSIDIMLEDGQTHEIFQQKVWFKVVNDLPTLSDIAMVFPQFGDTMGMTLSSTKQKDMTSTTGYDPLIIKLTASNAKDPDGAIAMYKRYFFNKDNPTRILEKKVTPANIPEVYFTLQRIAGEYEFGVTLVDNDGGEQMSKNIIGHGPSVFFPPDENNLDIPIVTLRQSAINVKVGDDIQFEVIAKVLSDRADFAALRSIKYDFDGDGTIDLNSKNDKITHYYSQDGSFTPRVKVVYRGIPGSAVGEVIKVDVGVRPLILLESYGSLVMGRDISIGSRVESRICMNASLCHHELAEDQKDPVWMKQLSGGETLGERSFIFQYPGTGDYDYELFVTDEYANKAIKSGSLEITGHLDIPLFPLTIPKVQEQAGGYLVTVGRQLDNTVNYFIVYAGTGECWMDKDITIDSDGDKNVEKDKDIECNTLHVEGYEPLFDSVVGRIYYEDKGEISSQDLTVHFLDSQLNLEKHLIPIYQNISSLVMVLDSDDQDIKYLKDLLMGLRSQLGDKVGIASQVITIRDHVLRIGNKLSETELNRLDVILYAVSDSNVTVALGGTPYEQAKQDVMLLMPLSLKQKIGLHFEAIENINGDKEAIKDELQLIIDLVRNNAGEGEEQIDAMDVDLIVMPKICQILNYYDIKSKACEGEVFVGGATTNGTGMSQGPVDTEKDGELVPAKKSVLKIILKVVVILLVVMALVFGGMVAFMYFKKKAQQEAEDSDGGDGGTG